MQQIDQVKKTGLVSNLIKILLSVLIVITVQCSSSYAFAEQAFVVRHIDVEGLHRVSFATLQNYLPIRQGQVLRPNKTSEIVSALYKTGFFERITLQRKGDTLVIRVVERPTIGKLKIEGNSVVPTDKLTGVMKSLDIAEGRVYKPMVLEKIKQSLLSQYYQLGRYNARVTIVTAPMPRNRVAVTIDISEGLVARIRRITILGETVYDEKTLLKQLDITTPGVFTFFTQTDRYSEDKLESSVEKIRNYYMDHGYIHVEVKSAQAEVTPDRKSVYVTIIISEGQIYQFGNYKLDGDMVVPRELLLKEINFKPGATFSRQKVLDIEKNLTRVLGDKGYLFASVNVHPDIDEETHTVNLTFTVHAGKRVYVRHVTFSDNTRTNDVVLRREIDQMEAAPVQTSRLESSKQRLRLLPYIKEVDMSVKPVPEQADQVDVNYKVTEESAAQASFKIGYSQLYGMLVGAGLNHKNFMGTGNTLGLNFNRSKIEQFYGIDFTNPYYTPEGISRSFNLSVSRVDPGKSANVDSSYTANEYDLGVLYGIPVSQEQGVFNRVYLGAMYQNILINPNRSPTNVSAQVQDFLKRHGRRYQQLDLRLGYSRDSRDRALFTNKGILQSVFLDAYAPIARGSLTFYTLNYHAKWYQPLTDKFIILTKGDAGYGNGLHGINDYPFFKNNYVGGIDSVRGYEGYTLGPRDSLGKSLGGNMFVDASIGLIFPNYISDNLRTTVFLDAGNAYSSANNRSFGGFSTNSGPVRYSFGIEANYLIPMLGPVTFSLAKAINPRRGHSNIGGDDLQPFQFSLGANF